MTYFGVARFRAWSLKRGVLDHPNERSSHVDPTPRGGGLVIAVVTIAVYIVASFMIGYQISVGFAVGAALILAISWLDDVRSVSFAWRLLVHSIAALLVLYSTGYLATNGLASDSISGRLGWLLIPIAFGWIVWMVNAFNFMDGIDGIAGAQAITASAAWAIIGLYSDQPGIFVLAGTLLFASFAFLLHNWPPARIFMGDAGSAFLGYVFAAMPFLVGGQERSRIDILIYSAIALLWMFVFDSIFTLLRRAAMRERLWKAHREHLYQRLVRSGYSHRTVTLIYFGLSAVAAACVGSIFSSDSTMPAAMLPFLLAGSAAAVVGICWKRGCLFGRVD